MDSANQLIGDKMTLVDHLQELRKRLIRIFIVLMASSFICYYFADKIVALLTVPVGKLYYLNPAEAFFAYLKISVFAGFLLAMPFLLYEVWLFIKPALTRKESASIQFAVPISMILFVTGLAFCYYLILPSTLKFFMSYASEGLQPIFSLGQYLALVLSFFLIFGFIFELPLLIIILAKLGFITSKYLASKRKLVLVLSFVIAVFLAPTPDVFSQCMVAIPIMFLYEISLLFIKYILRK